MSNTVNVDALFSTVAQNGSLTQAEQDALNAMDVGRQIQAAIGLSADDVVASRVTLYGMLTDDSGSIRMAGNSQHVRDGHNLVIDALRESKQREDILMMSQYLNGQVLFPYCLLGDAVRMDQHNYNPNGGTPLYDQSLVFLTTGMLKVQEFEDNGVQARGCWLIVTDGADAGSRRATPAMVADMVTRLYLSENHIVAGMGISDGYTDFRQVFRSMGIRDEWILTPRNTGKDIRKAFQLFSQSAVRASQHAGGMSQLGGFGA